MKKVVLMVDDELIWGDYLQRILPEDVSFFPATNFSEARKMFIEHKPSCVVLDACVEKMTFDSLPFLLWLLDQGFKGKIIAYSNSELYMDELCKNGATHSVPKHQLRKLLELICG